MVSIYKFMKTNIPAAVRVVLLLVVMISVFWMMLICSSWNFASSDPYPAQTRWLTIGEIVSHPAKILPRSLPGGLQFSVVFFFWATLGYVSGNFILGCFIGSTRQDSSNHSEGKKGLEN